MTTRKRVRSRYPSTAGGGGGPAPAGNCLWGPDFGNPVELEAAAHVSLDALSLVHTKTVGVTPLLAALAGVWAAAAGATATMPALALVHDKTVGANVTAPALALAHEKTVGAHCSGTATGAPFWQSEAHTFGAAGSAAAVTVSKPSGTVDGDLLLMHVATQNAVASGVPTFTVPAGWTTISNTTFSGTTSILRSATYWKVASSEPATYDITPSSTGHQGLLIEIHRINGTDGTTPINANAVATLAAAALNPDPAAPSVTTTAANCLVFAFLAHDHGSLSQSHTPGASHVERTDFEKTDAAALKLGLSSQTRVFAATGATSTIAFNCTESTGTDAMMQRVAVAPGALVLAA